MAYAAASKVTIGNETIIDLTGDTVAADKMLAGITAHSKTGAAVTGNIPTKTESDIVMSGGEIVIPAGYYAEAITITMEDLYMVDENGHTYIYESDEE